MDSDHASEHGGIELGGQIPILWQVDMSEWGRVVYLLQAVYQGATLEGDLPAVLPHVRMRVYSLNRHVHLEVYPIAGSPLALKPDVTSRTVLSGEVDIFIVD